MKKYSKRKKIIIGVNVAKNTILTPAPRPIKIPILVAIKDLSRLDLDLRYFIE